MEAGDLIERAFAHIKEGYIRNLNEEDKRKTYLIHSISHVRMRLYQEISRKLEEIKQERKKLIVGIERKIRLVEEEECKYLREREEREKISIEKIEEFKELVRKGLSILKEQHFILHETMKEL